MGNYKDSTLEKLADHGNGNYAYIDSLNEARKVLVEQVGGTLETIAKDVKLQIEFNPAEVTAYRLIGYENRVLRHQDFNDDQKDAGDMGAGHTVTALFEVVPQGVAIDIPTVDPLRYQTPPQPAGSARRGELMTLKLRCKEPESSESKLMVFPIMDSRAGFAQATSDYRFATAVAAFGMALRQSSYRGEFTLDHVLEIAEQNRGSDAGGYRNEFIELVNDTFVSQPGAGAGCDQRALLSPLSIHRSECRRHRFSGIRGNRSGMTVREVANLLVKDYAVYNALNLDGGGSTSLAIDSRMVTSGSREVVPIERKRHPGCARLT
jgi:Ca-activated chloride channel family protein